MKTTENMDIFLRYVVLAIVCLAVLLLSGCKSNQASVQAGPPTTLGEQSKTITVRPVMAGQGQPMGYLDEDGNFVEVIEPTTLVGYKIDGAQYDGQVIRSGDIAMQVGLMAQGLPTENWFSQSIPTLFGVDQEEARVTLLMYGVQLEMWALRQVKNKTEPTTVEYTAADGAHFKITTGGYSFEFHPDEVPEMPKLLSGLQRLGIGGREILGGLLAYFAFDLAKTNSDNAAANSRAAIEGSQGAFESGANTFQSGAEFGLGAGQEVVP